jgi:hypothetical protein
MESKQTAVEWLVNRWKKLQSEQEKMTWNQIIQITELAKEMEKEQHQQTAMHFFPTSLKKVDFEQYYNETYGK